MTRRVTSPVFIGREAELRSAASIRAEAVRSGVGATILVSGEAGIGKSRFATEIASAAAADGWTVLRGACDEFSAEAWPFAALAEMAVTIREVLTREAPTELEQTPWLAISRLERSPETEGGPSLAAGAMAYLALDLFQRMARVRPLLVIVDDLHWASESTRHLFVALARGLQSVPAVVVGCYRQNEVGRGHPLLPVLATVERNARPEWIALDAFTFDEVGAFQAAVASEFRCDPVSLFSRSGGNAFLLEELLATPAGTLPTGVAEVVLARLEALGADAISVAEAASLDSSLPIAVLARAADLPPERFEAASDMLLERGMLRIAGEEAGFRHALIREVIHDRIPLSQRKSLHRRAAKAFQLLESRRTSEAARHWILAGDTAMALGATIAAARSAAGLGAFPEAADHYERALNLWAAVNDPEAHAGMAHPELVVATANSLIQARRYAMASTLIERELRTAPCTPSQRSALFVQLGTAYIGQEDLGRVMPAFRKALECLDESVSPSQQIETAFWFSIEAVLTFGLDSEVELVLRYIGALEGSATSPTDELQLARMRAIVAITMGWPNAWELVEEVLLRSQFALRSGTVLLRALLGEHQWNCTDGIAERDRVFEKGYGPVQGVEIDARIAHSFSRLGRWKEGLERLQALVRELGEEATLESESALTIYGWGAMLVRTGRTNEASRWVDLAAPFTIPVITCLSMGFAVVRVELARIDRNREASRIAVESLIHGVSGLFMALSAEAVAFAVAVEADFAFELGVIEPDSIALVDSWIARLESCLVDAPGRVHIDDFGTFLEQCRAERARLAGADDPARWERLAMDWEALPRPYHAAYSRFRAAWALLTGTAPAPHKDRQRATALLAQARATSQELGAIYLERDIESLWRTAGLRDEPRPPGPGNPKPKASAGPVLTARELQVLALVSRGDSNGQIAIALDISARTAAVHVSNIMHKLGATTRIEAAMRARDLGIVESLRS